MAWRRGSRPHGRGRRPPLPRFDPDSARRPPLPRFDPEQAARVWPPEPPAPATRGSPSAALHVLRDVAAPCRTRSASPLPASRGCLPVVAFPPGPIAGDACLPAGLLPSGHLDATSLRQRTPPCRGRLPAGSPRPPHLQFATLTLPPVIFCPTKLYISMMSCE